MTSLIVPVLDDAAVLQETLPRLARLPGLAELLVVDGGSGDASAAVARAHGATVVASAPGRGGQLNAGARAARSDLLVFLHADCWLDEGALKEAARRVQDSRVAAGVFRQRIEGRRAAYRCIERAATWRALLWRLPYGDSGLFLRRAVFDDVGGFPDIPLCEDLGIALRLRRRGRIVVADSQVHLSPRRWETRGVARTTLLNWWVALSFRAGVPPERLYRTYYGGSRLTGDPRA